MELHGFDRQIPMPEAFVGSIVEVDHGLLERAWERGCVDGVSMIVRGNDDLSMLQIFDRLITAAMSVRQFERGGAAG